MQLFIDTNIFLSFYHMTNEDLVELKKLVRMIKDKEITLLLPQQVVDETWRNRSAKINDSLSPLLKMKFAQSFPSYCKAYEEYNTMRELQKKIEEQHTELTKKISADVASRNLHADLLLEELFGISTTVERSEDLIAKARERLELGNPPGKKGSLGDAINWETLLSVQNIYGLTIISDDADFFSPLDSNKLNEFMSREWEVKKKSQITFYRKLSDFFRKKYPKINLDTENQKDKIIEDLAASRSFASTHAAIAALSKHDGFTQKQIEDIVSAALSNNQVSWILGDDDVYEFFNMIHHRYFFQILDFEDKLGGLLEQAKTHQ